MAHGEGSMSEIEKLLRQAIPSELASAIDETPALIVPVLVSFAALEAIPRNGTLLATVPTASFHIFAGCLAALLGVIFYAGGDFWDRKWFDPRYKPGGSWTEETPSLFPSAENMVKRRRAAADLLLTGEDRKTQSGVYAAAEELARSRGRWNEVQSAVVISKFVRSFIWPSLLGFLLLLALTLVHLRVSLERAQLPALLAACCLFVAASSFPTYSKFRVKHMEQLYQLAARLKTNSPSQPTSEVL
jgi:hypothetical protein